MTAFLAAIALLLSIAGCSIPADAPSPVPAEVTFSPRDRQLIADFYEKYEFPPEIADPSVIAPDLETRLETTAKMPPDIAAIPLPVALEEKLSPLPPGYVRFRAGAAVILMDARIQQVIDQVPIAFH
jgi:hypothetical protein